MAVWTGTNQYHVEEIHICETTKFQKVGMLSNKLEAVKLIFAKFRITFQCTSVPVWNSFCRMLTILV
jgi:hypothetical protein